MKENSVTLRFEHAGAGRRFSIHCDELVSLGKVMSTRSAGHLGPAKLRMVDEALAEAFDLAL